MSTGNRLRLWTAGIIFVILYLLVRFGVGLFTDYLWFDHLNFSSVFMTGLWARVWVGLAVAIPFAVLFLVNVFIARWQSVRHVIFFSDETLVARRYTRWLIWGVALVLAWLVGTAASRNWLLFLRFLNQQPFELADPIFGQDVGFYVFSLPLYHFAQTWLVIVLFLSLLGAMGIYALAQQNNLQEGRLVILPHVQLHLSVLGALIFFAFAWGHWLDLFDLMYSSRGVAFGPSYTDVHVTIPALWTMVTVAVIAGLALLANTLIRRQAVSLLAIFIWVIVGIVGTGFIPGLVQRYVVEPNELTREAPYIEHNILFTNLAYGLDKVQERDFSEVTSLTGQDLANNNTTLKNIRLWDYRPLTQTYQQIQAIRLYYRFPDIDFDRYVIDGELRQVALAARELDKSRLQSPTWVTQKLQFTHGYGVVVNPVNEVTGEGLPRLWVKDLPPVSTVDLAVERPEIYYGETTDDHVFVHTGEREFSYPSGNENVYANYQGTGGVVLNSSLKRLAFALRVADLNMMLSQDFTDESRILLFRQIGERVRRVAPFLNYDRDPYIVIGVDGHLYWIQDAYTTSDLFPYAEPFGNINYIRNSVKVVIDAYDGDLIFYAVDPTDPVLQSYMAIFPRLFTPQAEMPEWLRAHLRYPEDLFRIQASLYQTYHMRDVNVFYNKEDLWQVPNESFEGNVQPVEPYYVVMRLPGETENEFMLIQPFTPNNKDNLNAWLAARSDGDNYGGLVAYRFPKQELVYGPLQIEARIDQDPEISAQISLWDRGGSEVIRGNMLVLPIDSSLLYVEPLYLRAENGQIPELKRVIVAAGDQIVMRETLADSLLALADSSGFGTPELVLDTGQEEPVPPDDAAPGTSLEVTPVSGDIANLAATASDHYEAAQAALRAGDWATYGEELEKLKAALDDLVRLTAEP